MIAKEHVMENALVPRKQSQTLSPDPNVIVVSVNKKLTKNKEKYGKKISWSSDRRREE